MYDDTPSAIREVARELQGVRLEISRVRDELWSFRQNQPPPPVPIQWGMGLMLVTTGVIVTLSLLFIFGFTVQPPTP